MAELPADVDGVTMVEELFSRTAARVVQRLRPDYAGWGGFEAWAPQNASRALEYVLTGE